MFRVTLKQRGHCSLRRLKRFFSLLWLLRPNASMDSSPSEQAVHLSQMARKLLDAHGVIIHKSGETPSSPSILVANHLGYLDPLAVMSETPCAVVAKAELSNWQLLGGSIRNLGLVFVQRGCANSGAVALRKAHRILQNNASVLIFPEGATSDGHHVSAFQRGAFGLSMKASIPVVPISIGLTDPDGCWTDDDSTFLRHYYQQAGKPNTLVRLHYHRGEYASATETAEQFAERIRALIETGLDDLYGGPR